MPLFYHLIIKCGDQSLRACADNVGVGACAPGLGAVKPLQTNVGGSGTFGAAVFHTVLREYSKLIALARHSSVGVAYCVERAVTLEDIFLTLAVVYKGYLGLNTAVLGLIEAEVTELYGFGVLEVTGLEYLKHVGDLQLLVFVVGDILAEVA